MFEPVDPAQTSDSSAWFCPACVRKAKGHESSLCPECGDRLERQGYCPICEREWLQPIGSFCPKHDVRLELPEADAWDGFTPDHQTAWVEIARFSHPSEALAPQLRLNAEGIPTFLDGQRVALESAYNLAVGGVKLLVPSPLEVQARNLLNPASTLSPHHALLDDDLDDAWDDLGPGPADRRRLIMKVLIVGMLLLPLFEVLFRILFG